VGWRNPLENALGQRTVRVKRPTVAHCRAEPDRQRRDVRSLHGLGVPTTPVRKTLQRV
jgi:hypothetical protein